MKFVIWGSSGHAKVLTDLLEAQGHHIGLFIDNHPNAQPAKAGVPLLHSSAEFKKWAAALSDRNDWRGVVAVGGGRGQERLQLLQHLTEAGIAIATLIHPAACVSPRASIGNGCQILANAIVATETTLGPGTILNHGAQADHECKIGAGVHLAPGATLCGCVEVGDHAFIGAGAVVLPRLKIGAGATVGAGAVVTKDVPHGITVMGNPARAIPS